MGSTKVKIDENQSSIAIIIGSKLKTTFRGKFMPSMTVLVVDDDPTNLAVFKHMLLKQQDCLPVSFLSPVEALEWCGTSTPDLVIVDYMMPGMDGVEFIRRFRILDGKLDIPVLMVTANTQVEVRYEALECGANDFLTKPVDKSEFSPRVKNMLALRKSQKLLGDRAALLAEEVHKATEDLRAQELETIYRLTKLAEYRDPETGAHIERMALYSWHIAKLMGLEIEEQELILAAAPMHDIGKVGVADSILLKPGKLDPAEFDEIKKHSQLGHAILEGSPSLLLQTGAIIALSHHEKFDGTGYPSGLKGEEIPLYGRIVAVADVFDALTSERPYKKAFTVEQALDMINEGSGKHFDPACVRAFMLDINGILRIKMSFGEAEAG